MVCHVVGHARSQLVAEPNHLIIGSLVAAYNLPPLYRYCGDRWPLRLPFACVSGVRIPDRRLVKLIDNLLSADVNSQERRSCIGRACLPLSLSFIQRTGSYLRTKALKELLHR